MCRTGGGGVAGRRRGRRGQAMPCHPGTAPVRTSGARVPAAHRQPAREVQTRSAQVALRVRGHPGPRQRPRCPAAAVLARAVRRRPEPKVRGCAHRDRAGWRLRRKARRRQISYRLNRGGQGAKRVTAALQIAGWRRAGTRDLGTPRRCGLDAPMASARASLRACETTRPGL